jgi:hypothetical protein
MKRNGAIFLNPSSGINGIIGFFYNYLGLCGAIWDKGISDSWDYLGLSGIIE